MLTVGIISARGGSKRLPGKNLAELGGRPLIAHTCEAALASGVLTAVYVNTDSPEIANAAKHSGVQCPALRPKHLATDEASLRDANLFMLDLLAKRGEKYQAVVILQPTSPLRAPKDIRNGLKLFDDHAPCAVVGVTPTVPQSWLGTVNPAGTFDRWEGDEVVHRVNGALYIYRWKDYVDDWPPKKTMAYKMPPLRSVDVDRQEDLDYARFLLQQCGSTVPPARV